MKKVVLTLVAMMAVTFGFAKSSNVDKRFDMSCDIYRLSVTLNLDDRQMDAVEQILHDCSREMQSLASLLGPRQRFAIRRAVRKDAHKMRRVLNDKQFNDYMRILMVTLRNRNL